MIAYNEIWSKLLSRLGYPSNKLRSGSLGKGAISEEKRMPENGGGGKWGSYSKKQ